MQTYRHVFTRYVILPPSLHSSKYVNNIYTIKDFAPSEEGRENAFAFACSFVMQYLPYFDDG